MEFGIESVHSLTRSFMKPLLLFGEFSLAVTGFNLPPYSTVLPAAFPTSTTLLSAVTQTVSNEVSNGNLEEDL